jgi:hypothetical protein
MIVVGVTRLLRTQKHKFITVLLRFITVLGRLLLFLETFITVPKKFAAPFFSLPKQK